MVAIVAPVSADVRANAEKIAKLYTDAHRRLVERSPELNGDSVRHYMFYLCVKLLRAHYDHPTQTEALLRHCIDAILIG